MNFLSQKNKVKYQFNKKVTIAITFLFFAFYAYTQNKTIIHSNQEWAQYYNKIRFSDKWSSLSDGGFRLKNTFSNKSQYIIRTAIGYHPNKNISFVVGFTHLGFYSSDKLSKIELRPYQDIIIKQKFGKISTGHRFRIEQRYFKTVPQNNQTVSSSFNHRFRYRFMIGIPIIEFPYSNGGKLTFNLGDEILINAGKQIVNNVFDQNRILAGPALHFNKFFSISLLYNHLWGSTGSPDIYTQKSIFWLGIKHTIDWREDNETTIPEYKE